MRNLLVILFLCFPVSAFAELIIKIDGPDKAKTGDLVVINSVGSVATVKQWIVPEALKDKTLMGCDDQLGFATREPGSYTFYLYGTDGTSLLHSSHTIVIEGATTQPPPPVEPPPVDPPPVGNYDELKKKSRDLSKGLNDIPIRGELAKALSVTIEGDSLEAAQKNVELIITTVLSKRPRDKQDADWFNEWYRPILAEFKKLNESKQLNDVNDYKQAIGAVAKGLSD